MFAPEVKPGRAHAIRAMGSAIRWSRSFLCAVFAAWLYHHFGVKRLALDINSLNTTLLFLCFLLHQKT